MNIVLFLACGLAVGCYHIVSIVSIDIIDPTSINTEYARTDDGPPTASWSAILLPAILLQHTYVDLELGRVFLYLILQLGKYIS